MKAKELSILFKKAKAFANEQGFNYIQYRFSNDTMAVYYLSKGGGKNTGCTGYPVYLKVSNNDVKIISLDVYSKLEDEIIKV